MEREKIVDYLLNPAHPDNGGKAQFFLSLGFRVNEWQAFASALTQFANTTEVSKRLESPHGTKYTLDGRLDSPDGRTAIVRTIWIVDRGQNAPRLVTAYPSREINQ